MDGWHALAAAVEALILLVLVLLRYDSLRGAVFDDSPLDPDYTVFGSISEEGLAVVQEVADAGAEGGAPDGPPAEPVEITGVTLG